MSQMLAMIQTSWPKIRVGLYQHENGLFQYIEEGLDQNAGEAEQWVQYNESQLFSDREQAKAEMIKFYCEQVEDEYVVDPESVVILNAPDFIGPHHPKLRLRNPAP